MINPYRSPTLDEKEVNRSPTTSAQSVALICFGLMPVAIIVVRVMEAIMHSVRGWHLSYWVLAVAPPLYLTCVWLFAIHVQRRRTAKLRMLLPVALLPLVLFLMVVWYVTIFDILYSGGFALTGWVAIDLLLWLAVSFPVTIYFVATMRSACRVRQNPNQSADEPSVATEAASHAY